MRQAARPAAASSASCGPLRSISPWCRCPISGRPPGRPARPGRCTCSGRSARRTRRRRCAASAAISHARRCSGSWHCRSRSGHAWLVAWAGSGRPLLPGSRAPCSAGSASSTSRPSCSASACCTAPSRLRCRRPPAAPGGIMNDTKMCPYCAETIRAEALKCRFCGSLVEPASSYLLSAPWTRRRHDRVFAGVCIGLAEQFGISVTIVRLAFALGTLLSRRRRGAALHRALARDAARAGGARAPTALYLEGPTRGPGPPSLRAPELRRALQLLAMAAGAAGFAWLLTHAGVEQALGGRARPRRRRRPLRGARGARAPGFTRGAGSAASRRHAPRAAHALRGLSRRLCLRAADAHGLARRRRAAREPASRAPFRRSEAAASVTADRLACSVADRMLGLGGRRDPARLRARSRPWHRIALVAATASLRPRDRRLLPRPAQRPARHTGSRRIRWWLASVARASAERLARAGADLDFRLRSLHLERPEAFRGALLRNLVASSWWGWPRSRSSSPGSGRRSSRGLAVQVFLVSVALDLFSFFIPARLGVQEGSRMLAVSVAGLDPALGLLLSSCSGSSRWSGRHRLGSIALSSAAVPAEPV